jgi:helicase-like protein
MSDYIDARDELISYVIRDQFGPYDDELEALSENPLRRYMVGILHPQGTKFVEADDDGGLNRSPQSKSDDSEPGLSMSNSVHPSSYGMTFACDPEIRSFNIFVQAAAYKPNFISSEEGSNEKQKKQKWQRIPMEWSGDVDIFEPRDSRIDLFEGRFSVRIRSRIVDKNKKRSITVSVVNEQSCSQKIKMSERAPNCFFQVHFGVKGIEEQKPFVNRSVKVIDETVSEENALRLLYRNLNIFAVGHGCSTEWDNNVNRERCGLIASSFVPKQTVYPMVQPADLGLPFYSIKKISESTPQELKEKFEIIPERYDQWINRLENESSSVESSLKPQTKEHIDQCRRSSKRVRDGIELIKRNKKVYKAFILMHQAMLHQLAHSEWLKADRPDEGPIMSEDHAWYPFQIAFILQCLESLSDKNSDDRDLVDLLWFPTGGGKTEAYLGIIGFLVFYRRLTSLNDSTDGGGTVALMRYTLRLLTVDQFYRAALLVCSCELVRREAKNGISSTAPVDIGLWVGGEASPNQWHQARTALEDINLGRGEPDKGSPIKLRECPWCGEEIGAADYTLPDEHTPMVVRCPNVECDFHEGLPVWITDTDVYRHRPTLIIGTVDKFARIPWVEEASSLFGSDGNTLPPELIIQDELHLISGPLGTLVGLYETAIDTLCETSDGRKPKIIASTATIRNAEKQVKALFCRKVCQFPPPGIEYSDSFFAKEDRELPGRTYIGVFTPGTSPTYALVKTFGIILHAGKQVRCPDNVRDAYWTLMGYFNSLRELGGASIQVEDDVNDYLEFCAERDGDRLSVRRVSNPQELTGRVASRDLDDIRENLWVRYPDEDCFDVVLATNMISVGLDVPRLGLMAVVGQPKSTSEYIQATSRIGRKYPGLVVTLYNWTRSRDRSHFERFKAYHSRLYSEVEATSVTPFSSRARDRGLHAVLVSLIRHTIQGMNRNSAAANFDADSEEVKSLVDGIIKRVSSVDEQELNDTERDLYEIIKRWVDLSQDGELPYAKKRRRDDRLPLLIPAEEATSTSQSFGTLNSLRNIDPAAGLNLEG